LLSILTGIDPVYGQAITCALVVLFTIMAGMASIVALDLVNGILITGGVLIAAPLALRAAGGWDHLVETLPETHFTIYGATGVAAALGLFFPTFFLLLGESSIYQKFMSAKNEATARRAVLGMIGGVVLVETVLVATAVFGAGLHWDSPAFRNSAGALDRATTETILLELGANDLPLVAGALLLVGAAAIIFSTANTFLMIPSTNLTRDVFQRFLKPDASQRAVVWFQRGTIVGLALVAFVVTSQFENILDMALYAYTMVGAAVTPALLAAFLWKRVTPAAGVASIAGGMAFTILFAGLVRLGTNSLNLGLFVLPLDYDYIIYPAGLASIALLVIVSLLTPPPPEEKWKPFIPSD
jgi:SSS family solute:Na+ symporter/sodium/proline symporter